MKALKNLEEDKVSFDDFNSLRMSFEKLKNRIDADRDAVPKSIRKFVKERSTEWEKEVLDMAEKFQETRGFMMELITLDLGHEVCLIIMFIILFCQLIFPPYPTW